MNKESILVAQIRLKASKMGWVLFRNNVGICKQGKRTVRYGLCVGSADLIGWKPIPVCGLHKNHHIYMAQFVAIEVKTDTGRITKDQQRFIDAVNAYGGLGIIARSLDDIK